MSTTSTPATVRRNSRRRSGFTLIELTAPISIVAVLVGSLLPAVQHNREAANLAAATTNMKQLGSRLQDFHRQNKKLPAGLADFLSAAGFPANGAKDGYTVTALEVGPARWRLAANPVPGVTGATSVFLNVDASGGLSTVSINFTKAPGADKTRGLMLERVTSLGATAFSQMVMVRPFDAHENIFRQTRAYVESPGAAEDAFRALQGGDRALNFSSIANALIDNPSFNDAAVRRALTEFWTSAEREVHLGVYNESWRTLPGINAPPSADPVFFSWGVLGRLTTHHVHSDGKLGELSNLVTEGEAARLRGDQQTEQKLLGAYIDSVAAASQGLVPSVNPLSAQMLISMARAMLPY